MERFKVGEVYYVESYAGDGSLIRKGTYKLLKEGTFGLTFELGRDFFSVYKSGASSRYNKDLVLPLTKLQKMLYDD